MATLMQNLINQIAQTTPDLLPDMAPLVAYWAIAALVRKDYVVGLSPKQIETLNIYATIAAPEGAGRRSSGEPPDKTSLIEGALDLIRSVDDRTHKHYKNETWRCVQGLYRSLLNNPVQGAILDGRQCGLGLTKPSDSPPFLGGDIRDPLPLLGGDSRINRALLSFYNSHYPLDKGVALSLLVETYPYKYRQDSWVDRAIISRFLFRNCDSSKGPLDNVGDGRSDLSDEIKTNLRKILDILDSRVQETRKHQPERSKGSPNPPSNYLSELMYKKTMGGLNPMRVQVDEEAVYFFTKGISDLREKILEQSSIRIQSFMHNASCRMRDNALKLSALSAVLQDPTDPVITLEMAEDAFAVVERSINDINVIYNRSAA